MVAIKSLDNVSLSYNLELRAPNVTIRPQPSLSPWVESCYGVASVLNFGDTTILSTTGVQQGDPLGPLLFSLVEQPVIEQLQEIEGLNQNSWYLDDGLLVGTKEALSEAWDLLVREGEPRGLYLSRDKSLVFCPAHEPGDLDPIGRGVTRAVGGFKLLGAPLGDRDFEEDLVERRLADISHLLERLPLLEDPHMEFTLLKNCFAFPKFAFTLRTLDTSNHPALLDSFDQAVRGALEGILGSPLPPAQWQQATLPVSKGGMGLRKASSHGAAAFLGSLVSSQLLVQEIRQKQLGGPALEVPDANQLSLDLNNPPNVVAAALQDLNAQLGDPLTYGEVTGMTQRSLSVLVDTEASSRLLQATVDERELARLRCVGREGAGDWLTAFPSKALGLHLRRSEFVAAAKYRLGLPVFEREAECPMPRCPGLSDNMGDHAISCGLGGERIARHNHVRDALFQAAVQAGLGPRKEPDGLLPGSDDRPADVLIPFWTGGQDTALDVTVVNPLQTALVTRASQDGESAVDSAHRTKARKYEERCSREGITFIPLAVDTLGGWHPIALKTITRLGRQLARNIGKEDVECVRHLRQRLAVLLVRDNVALLCARTPTFPAPEVDGDDDY